LAGALLFDEKSTEVHLYLGLDCGMMEFFTNEPQSKEQLMPLPHLWDSILHEAAQDFEVF
jgi:hypothetical protein